MAFNMQKLAKKSSKGVIVATTRSDLFEDLKVSVHIHKRFGKEITVLDVEMNCAGVIAYCYPSAACLGRLRVLPKMSIQEQNEKLSIISRVVVHPKYRTIGLGSKLVGETLAFAGTPFVEMAAVMAEYNPFAEKVGMKKIAEQPPAEEALAIADALSELGFNIQFFGSEKYVLKKLQNLKAEEVFRIR